MQLSASPAADWANLNDYWANTKASWANPIVGWANLNASWTNPTVGWANPAASSVNPNTKVGSFWNHGSNFSCEGAALEVLMSVRLSVCCH